MKRSEEAQGVRLVRCCKGVLLGGGAALLVCVAFLLLAAAAVSRGLIDAGLRDQLAVVGCVLGSFCGGLLAVGRCPGRSLPVGLASGAVLFLLQLTLGLLTCDTMSFENGGLGLLCGALCGGAAAGILGGGRPQKARRGKKRRSR